MKFTRRVLALPWVEDVPLVLEPDPKNPFDPDAIKIMFEWSGGKLFHLGFVPNAKSHCEGCGEWFDRHPGACPNCGNKKVARWGTATVLSEMIASTPGLKPWAVVTEVTGGTEGKSLGANIAIWAD